MGSDNMWDAKELKHSNKADKNVDIRHYSQWQRYFKSIANVFKILAPCNICVQQLQCD